MKNFRGWFWVTFIAGLCFGPSRGGEARAASCKIDLLKLIPDPEGVQKILWLDLETGGRDPVQPILELSAAVLDGHLNIQDRYHAVAFQLEETLNALEPEAKAMHLANGLLEDVRKHGKYLNQIEQELLEILGRHFAKGVKVYLAGNSVNFDLRFLQRYFPNLAKYFSYRVLDVSSFRLAAQLLYGVKADKPYGHRSALDVELSIREFATYLDLFSQSSFAPPKKYPEDFDPDGFF